MRDCGIMVTTGKYIAKGNWVHLKRLLVSEKFLELQINGKKTEQRKEIHHKACLNLW